jgi:hypothetical protein
MSTFGDVIDAIQQRTSYDGADYLPQIKRAINWAKDEICSVNWKFLWRYDTTTITTAAGDLRYGLSASFSRIDAIFVNSVGATYIELQEASEVDIVLAPELTSGIPKLYSFAGVSATTGLEQIAIGCPTPGGSYPVRYSYYALVPDMVNDGDISLIQYNYRDTPLISGGLYKFHKDLDEQDLAQDVFKDFVLDMSAMEGTKPFNGPSYKEILASRSGA